jgi:hypothetical protein
MKRQGTESTSAASGWRTSQETRGACSMSALPAAVRGVRSALAARHAQVRAHSLALAAPASAEDQCVQAMPDASPTKWHLAHTSWFFEAVVLAAHCAGYRPFDARWSHLFNSYYEALAAGIRGRSAGCCTRPRSPRCIATARMSTRRCRPDRVRRTTRRGPRRTLVELGLQHEQQHQELLLTDILHALWCNPLLPAYAAHEAPRCGWRRRRCTGSRARGRACASGMTARASPSTTRRPGIASGCSPTASPTGW